MTSKSSVKIAPRPPQRLRYHVDIVGNARQWMEMLAGLSEDELNERIKQVDPRENFYVVSLTQSKNGTVSESAHALHISQALLRFGNERLCQAGVLQLLGNGHDKATMLGETLCYQRYDWFDKVYAAIETKDREALAKSGGSFGPLFYWACSPPPCGKVEEYNRALDSLLRLPPYENRRDKVNKALEEAFLIALKDDNTVAMGVLHDRGLVASMDHVVQAVQSAAPEALAWLLESGPAWILQSLSNQEGLNAKECASALKAAAECESPGSEEFNRIVGVMQILAWVPGFGECMMEGLLSGEDHPHWNKECEAVKLSIQTPAPSRAARSLRI